MDQDLAYRVMMGWATKAKIRAHMQKTVTGDWEVIVFAPGHAERRLANREDARAYWTQCKAEGLIPA